MKYWEAIKTPFIFIVILFLGLFLYTKLAGPIPFFINSVQTTKSDLFSVSGTGEETAAPDQAVVDLGVTKSSGSVLDAQNQTNTSISKIISDIKSKGIADKDIKTNQYSINQDYQTKQYSVTANLEVKIKPIDKVNSVIDGATANGANLVNGINFTFSDELQKSLENKAREEAVSEAKQKAGSLAKAAGINLGRIVNVTENSSSPRPMPLGMGAADMKALNNSAPTQLQPGENSVSTTVTISYETF